MQDGPDPFVLTEAEKDSLKRKRRAPGPEPPSPPATQRSEEYDDDEPEDVDEEDDAGEAEPGEAAEDEDDQPNLQMFFDQFDIPDERVISMCRAYASYLVSLRPKTPSKTAASKVIDSVPGIAQKVQHWIAKRRRRQ